MPNEQQNRSLANDQSATRDLEFFPPRVDRGQFMLLALMFLATPATLLVQLSAHGGFLFIGALDPAVDPCCFRFHTRHIRTEPDKRAADVGSARRKFRGRRLLCFVE